MSGPVNILLQKLPPYKGDQRLVNRRQDTFDIIREILRKHKACNADYDKICMEFWKGNPVATAEGIYNYAKLHLPYRVEPTLKQSVKTPGAILSERFDFGNDCKHYASFAVGIAEALRRRGYPMKAFYRFASYNPKRRAPGHVFAVIVDGGQEYWVDPVPEIGGFNRRAVKPVFVTDKMPPMSKNGHRIGSLYDISGIGDYPISNQQLVSGMAPTNIISGHWLDELDVMHGIGKSKKHQEKKAARKKKHTEHKAQRKAGTRGIKKLAKKIKPGKLLAKYGLATSRNAYLSLVELNVFDMATKIWPKVKGKNTADWKRLADKWAKLGGKPDALYKNIQKGVNTHNKLHPKKKISGYDAELSGCEHMNSPWHRGYYDPYMSPHQVRQFVHGNHHRRRMLVDGEGRLGVVQVGVAAGVIAAAAPIIKALSGLLKSFGVNTKKAADTAEEDTAAVAEKHNDDDKSTTDENGVTTHADGTQTEVVDNEDGSQSMIVKKIPGLKGDGGSNTASDTGGGGDDDSDDDTTTKTKTVTKTKTKSGGGDDDSGSGFSAMLANVTGFVSDHKMWFIGGGIALLAILILPKIMAGSKPKRRR